MGLRFRQSIKLLPGLRINFGLRGISVTVGPRGANLSLGTRGTYLNLGLPGTGISYRARLDKTKSLEGSQSTIRPEPEPEPQTHPDLFNRHPPFIDLAPHVIEFRSVDVASLGSSESLERVSALCEKLQSQRHIISAEITQAEKDVIRAARMSRRFAWLRRWIASTTFKSLQEYHDDCLNRLDVLKEIKQSLVLDVEFSISDGAKKAFLYVTAAFDRVSRSARIWDITSAQAVDRYRTRSAASKTFDTQPVSFDRTYDALMATEFRPPRFVNTNGADLMLYPAFVMVQIGERVALLDIRQVEITIEPTRFVVYDGNVPSDSMVIDSTWQYVNKDGGPDRRFSNNPTIPIAKYCNIFFRGEGLNEAWMISNAEAGIEFGEAIRRYKNSLTDSEREIDGIAPPSADEWPELDIPDKPKLPPRDWKTPITFYSCVIAVAGIALFFLGKTYPHILSSVIDFANLFGTRKVVISTEANSRVSEGKIDSPTIITTSRALTRAEVSEVQQLLKKMGLEPGPPDGIAGAKTLRAFSDWAKIRGIENAKLDTVSLKILRQTASAKRR
jgi:hypothetical protein